MDDLPQAESAEGLELSLEDRVRDARHYAQRLDRELSLFPRVVEALEAGRFISSTDRIKEYRELSRFQDTYEVLLRMMGHELRHHTTGFYYLQPREMSQAQLPQRERMAAAAIFSLIEHFCDKGLPIESMITHEEPIILDDLGAMFNQYHDRLTRLGLGSVESFIDNGIRRLVDVGVMNERRLSQDKVAYTLGLPAYFYLDICRRLADQHQQQLEAKERGEDYSYSDRSVDELADDFLNTQPDEDDETPE
ncbi:MULTISPECIES: chromosome partition protein MukE [Pseudomonas]|nr:MULTISPECIES: chromosome partition protein MukE [Pseudomonas]MBH8755549.1 chromosome partition protein MukE [Pseudomonas aeruginosa]HCL4085456.1 chromosome partition protein MukE [Pseudomonas aeruginosa]HCL4245215.1 chromosome partition protein MukE [Pseudomonas aeruginosa]